MMKILLFDEVPVLRRHVAQLASQVLGSDNPLQYLEAQTDAQALELAEMHKPSIIVMDVTAYGTSTVQLAERIWQSNPNARILFWTQSQRDVHLTLILKAVPETASYGYVLKTESDEKLRYAMESVLLHNNNYVDPVYRAAYARRQSKWMRLTDAEKETLADLLLGLTDKAMGLRRGLSVRGAQNRLASLSAKLMAGDSKSRNQIGSSIFNQRTRMIFEAFRCGLIDVGEIHALDEDLADWFGRETFRTRTFAS